MSSRRPRRSVKKLPTDTSNGAGAVAGAVAGATAGPTPVKTQSAKSDGSDVPNARQIEALAEKATSIIEQETEDITRAKAAADKLLSQFKEGGVLDANAIPKRQEKTANVFPFYIGRLNPPHLFHLLSLFTAIFIARQHGTKALFILGSGPAKAKRVSDLDPRIENPLPDELKWRFINSKLREFGFVVDEDYEIVKLGYPNGQLKDFIVGEVGRDIVPELTIVQIGGDKPEPKSKGGFVLDVDKFLDKDGLFTLRDLPATYKQAVIVSGKSVVRVINEKGQPEERGMSASLLRETACNCLKYKGDPDKAFNIWFQLFTPMYIYDKLSRDVFNKISVVTCGVAAAEAPGGGSRRKHTIRKLRNKKTLLHRRSRRRRVVSRNKTKRRK
jgi:hypothetical protein